MSDNSPRVLILMGSANDWPVLEKAHDALRELGVATEVHVCSAHRSPTRASELASGARGRGISVIIAGAGGAAHLAGVVAAHTTLPVIGVPVFANDLQGLDALLSTVQMPSGVPVATVGIGRAANAGLLAAQILAIADDALAARLARHKDDLAAKTAAADAELNRRLAASGTAAP
jgi:phosphoribosylaminoimidazole carboxylase PurE protein